MIILNIHKIPKKSAKLNFNKFHWLCLIIIIQQFFSFNSNFSQTASFVAVADSGSFCAPARIKFQPTFSEPPVSYFWSFGIGGEESDEKAPSFTYPIPGSFTVRLIVLFSNTIIEVQKIVRIYGEPVIQIFPSKSFICTPEQINLSLQTSIPLANISWNFGDGVTESGNGTFTTVNHFFDQFKDHIIEVSAISAQGCKGVAESIISLNKPTANFTATKKEVCIPSKVAFEVNPTIPTGSNVTSFSWQLGDGSPEVITDSNSYEHTYNLVDSVRASVTIITSEGCTNTFNFPVFSTGSPPIQAKIFALADTICISENAIFYEVNGTSNGYTWEIGNRDTIRTLVGELSYKFGALGSFSVKVTPKNNGCPGSPDSLKIFVRGVLARFTTGNRCDDKRTFNLTNRSIGGWNFLNWSFGDGSPDLPRGNRITHQFPPTGVFPVMIYLKDTVTGCYDSSIKIMYTATPVLVPTDTFICRGSMATMKVVDSYRNPRAIYSWGIAGRIIGVSSDSSISISAATAGTFSNYAIINNYDGYCPDTLFQQTSLRVGHPTARFNLPAEICLFNGLKLSDNSTTSDSFDNVIGWDWALGDSTFSNLKNPDSLYFNLLGTYALRLLVNDNKGCIDSIRNTIKVRRLPFLRISPGNQKVCEGKDFTLAAITQTPVKWSPPNEVSCPTCDSVTVAPQKPTVYKAITTDSIGCTTEQSIALDVWSSFTLPPNLLRDTGVCPGGVATFDLKTTDKIIQWSPSTGLTEITKPVTQAAPLVTTLYTAAISDSGKCFTRSVSATVTIYPLPIIDMGQDLILPYNANFTLNPTYTGANIASYNWQPANELSCQNCPSPSGIVTKKSIFTVNVTSDNGCRSSGRIQVNVECDPKNIWMPTAFSPNNDGLNDTYYPLTRGIIEIKKFIIYNRFGELVYEKINFKPNDNSLGWNGQFNGTPQSSGAYIYFVEAVCEVGGIISKKGNFIIIR